MGHLVAAGAAAAGRALRRERHRPGFLPIPGDSWRFLAIPGDSWLFLELSRDFLGTF